MVTQEQIESKGFSLYTTSLQSSSNPAGDRYDYVSLAKVGKAEYLIQLQYFPDLLEVKVKDFWNDPLPYPEYYAVGEMSTEDELDHILAKTGFETYEVIDFEDIWLYR